MSTVELNLIRKELSQWVNTISDTSLLQTLSAIKSTSSNNNDWWNDLTPDEKRKIDLGLNDFNDNKTMSSKDFWQQLISYNTITNLTSEKLYAQTQ